MSALKICVLILREIVLLYGKNYDTESSAGSDKIHVCPPTGKIVQNSC